jgi:hypothetical protein
MMGRTHVKKQDWLDEMRGLEGHGVFFFRICFSPSKGELAS